MTEGQPQENQPSQETKQEDKLPAAVKEIPHRHPPEKSRRWSFGRATLGLVLIFIGLVYLGQTTGWIHVNFSFDWWRLWPLLLVFWGLSLLAGRGWMSGLIGILVIITVLVMIGLLILNKGTISQTTPNSKSIEIAREEAGKTAEIAIKAGAGKLMVGDGGTDRLVAGLFESNISSLTTSSTLEDGKQTVALKEESFGWRNFGNHVNKLDLKLNKNVPLKLTVDSGAMDMELDLKEIMAEAVDIDTGASSMKLEMGDKVTASSLNINAGASSLTISLPKSLGAKLSIEAGLSSKDLPNFKKADDSHYESENYGSAEKKIDLTLKMGVSSLKIIWQ